MAEVAALNPESAGSCPLCKKTFVKDSTLKRHQYYCRSKRPDASASRRRSCAACMRAKTRCTWLFSVGSQTCARCNERGIRCEYDHMPRQELVPFRSSSDTATGSPRRSAQAQGIQANTALAFPPKTSITTEDFSIGAYAQRNLGLQTAFDTAYDSTWNLDFGPFPTFTPDNKVLSSRDAHAVSNTVTTLTDTLVTGITTTEPTPLESLSLNPFNFRTISKPTHGSLFSFATRILRSYPFMMLQSDTFPPFLSAQMFNWAKTGQGPRQQALLNCVSLIQIFKTRTEQSKNLIWRLIRTEQQRILAECTEFDQWELLASMQALLMYCLLRLQDDPTEEEGFDASLLHTVNVISDILCSMVVCDCSLPTDPDLAWRDWLFNESRRRTALVFRAINMLVDISAAITCYPATGFGLIPLPCEGTLWNARDVNKWKTNFGRHCSERTLYSLSESGLLVKLQASDALIHQTVVPWEEWNCTVGEVGTLVMIMGELLS